jgi:methoxymalonate biosynthesis protein
VPDGLAGAVELVDDLVGDQAGVWDRAGELPVPVLTRLGRLLAAEIPARYGGIGASSRENGEFTAYVGSRCSSLRSVMTSQAMAAWTIRRMAGPAQRSDLLPRLAGGTRCAVAFSEPGAGSDLAAMTTRLSDGGDGTFVLDGGKRWITAACYADLFVVVARYGEGAAVVVVPPDAPGVRVDRITDPLGCRAAGHADLTFDRVRLQADALLGGELPMSLLVTTALAAGRMSVAWGCVGILRACLTAATRHAAERVQFGRPLAEHQLVARHLAELFAAERVATRLCEQASTAWDAGSPDLVIDTVLAKHVSAGHAARGAASAVQVLASAGARDGEVVARAFRDAKLMEVIEGTNEICQLILAGHAIERHAVTGTVAAN